MRENNISKINWAIEKYMQLEKMDGVKAVAIGGSVSRNYPEMSGDIDIIYFSEKYDIYRKRKEIVEGILCEVHCVPNNFIKLMIATCDPITNSNYNFNVDELKYMWGEKLCPSQIQGKSNTGIKLLLSAWREFRKLEDVQVVYGKEWYIKNIALYNNICGHPEKVKLIMDDNFKKNTPLENLILLFKLEATVRKNVYSKVFWTDYYINKYNNSELTRIINNIFVVEDINKNVIELWDKWIEQVISNAALLHKTKQHCQICKGEFEKCNIGRCSRDYLEDARRAYNNDYIISCLLCLWRTLEYSVSTYKSFNLSVNKPKEWLIYWEQVNKNIICNFEKIYNLLW